MDERVLQFRIGIVAVAALIITVYLIFMFGEGPTLIGRTKTIYIRFKQAPGVTVGTPVRKSGVLIGRVQSVELLDNSTGVLVTITVEDKYKLRRTEVCRIASDSLLGDAVLEFVPGGNLQPTNDKNVFLEDGDFISNGLVSSNPLDVISNMEEDLKAAILSITRAGIEVQQLAGNLNTAIGNNDDQIRRIMLKTETALDQFHTTLGTIDSVFGDEELNAGLRESMKSFPMLVANANTTLETVNVTFQDFQRVGKKAETNLDNLEKFTRPLGERGEELVMDLQSTVRSLDDAMSSISSFAKSIDQSEGTIGKLIHDPQLYNRLNAVAGNMEDISTQFQPIVDNFRIFSDKIARDPRQLGVKGALSRNPHGFKPMVFQSQLKDEHVAPLDGDVWFNK